MTVRRLLASTAVVALVAAAAAVLVFLGRAAVTSSSPPLSLPAAVSLSSPASSPSPSSSAPSVSSVASPVAAPAPFVQLFSSDEPTTRPLPKLKSPKAPVKVPAFVDGCDHNYGTPTQCVPLTFPDGITGVAAKCAWLDAHGFTGLIVAGRDTQDLDADGDGTAC